MNFYENESEKIRHAPWCFRDLGALLLVHHLHLRLAVDDEEELLAGVALLEHEVPGLEHVQLHACARRETGPPEDNI